MMDYMLLDVLINLEKMTGKSFYYLADAVKSGKLDEIKIKFEVEKDNNEVPVKVQHLVELSWNA